MILGNMQGERLFTSLPIYVIIGVEELSWN